MRHRKQISSVDIVSEIVKGKQETYSNHDLMTCGPRKNKVKQHSYIKLFQKTYKLMRTVSTQASCFDNCKIQTTIHMVQFNNLKTGNIHHFHIPHIPYPIYIKTVLSNEAAPLNI